MNPLGRLAARFLAVRKRKVPVFALAALVVVGLFAGALLLQRSNSAHEESEFLRLAYTQIEAEKDRLVDSTYQLVNHSRTAGSPGVTFIFKKEGTFRSVIVSLFDVLQSNGYTLDASKANRSSLTACERPTASAKWQCSFGARKAQGGGYYYVQSTLTLQGDGQPVAGGKVYRPVKADALADDTPVESVHLRINH